VQILLEKGYEAVLAEFESMDREEVKEEVREVREEIQIVRSSPEPNPQLTYDMKAYAEFSNKTIYEPRKMSHTNNNTSPDSRVARFQQKLGLRQER
jgi:hypothetical protein